MKEQLRTEAEKVRTFRTVKIKDRLPDFGQRILFLDENYDKEFMSEYLPNQEIEIKKGSFIEIKDCPEAIAFIKGNFTHWFEEVDNAMLDFHAQQLEKPVERLKSIIEACPKGIFKTELSKVLKELEITQTL